MIIPFFYIHIRTKSVHAYKSSSPAPAVREALPEHLYLRRRLERELVRAVWVQRTQVAREHFPACSTRKRRRHSRRIALVPRATITSSSVWVEEGDEGAHVQAHPTSERTVRERFVGERDVPDPELDVLGRGRH
jgi:hypothetical protein